MENQIKTNDILETAVLKQMEKLRQDMMQNTGKDAGKYTDNQKKLLFELIRKLKSLSAK